MANAEENKKTQDNFFTKLGKGCMRFFKGIGRGFMNMIHELKKVTWPTKREIVNYSLVVLIFMVIMTIIVGVFDLGAGALIDLIVGL